MRLLTREKQPQAAAFRKARQTASFPTANVACGTAQGAATNRSYSHHATGHLALEKSQMELPTLHNAKKWMQL
jgi:hypothetical protein